MIKVALRGLAGRKLRAVLTGIAIVLGVAMISGTYILTDTVQRAFNELLVDSYAGTDAVVTGKGLDISIDGDKPPPPPVDASLLDDRPRRRRRRARDRQHPRRGQHEGPDAGGRGRELGGLADARLRHRHRPGARSASTR